jgi:hypothetical protein
LLEQPLFPLLLWLIFWRHDSVVVQLDNALKKGLEVKSFQIADAGILGKYEVNTPRYAIIVYLPGDYFLGTNVLDKHYEKARC